MHPLYLLDADDHAMLELWRAWRAGGGMGAGFLPAAGGAGDQPACVMRSLGIMDSAYQALTPRKGE